MPGRMLKAIGEDEQKGVDNFMADQPRPAAVIPAGTWLIDPAHTMARFTVRHMTIAPVSGRFPGVSGTVLVPASDPLAAIVTATLDVVSVTTGVPRRDDMIRSAEFLDAASYPAIAFQSKPATPRADGDWDLPGDLTIKGVTRPARLDLAFGGLIRHRGATRAGFTAAARINRKDFGVSFNGLIDTGGAVVSDAVEITIAAEIVLQEPDD